MNKLDEGEDGFYQIEGIGCATLCIVSSMFANQTIATTLLLKFCPASLV